MLSLPPALRASLSLSACFSLLSPSICLFSACFSGLRSSLPPQPYPNTTTSPPPSPHFYPFSSSLLSSLLSALTSSLSQSFTLSLLLFVFIYTSIPGQQSVLLSHCFFPNFTTFVFHFTPAVTKFGAFIMLSYIPWAPYATGILYKCFRVMHATSIKWTIMDGWMHEDFFPQK